MSRLSITLTEVEALFGEAPLRVIRDLIFHQLMRHPLPWRIEEDWSTTVEAADGTRIFGPPFQRADPTWVRRACEAVVWLAEDLASDIDLPPELT